MAYSTTLVSKVSKELAASALIVVETTFHEAEQLYSLSRVDEAAMELWLAEEAEQPAGEADPAPSLGSAPAGRGRGRGRALGRSRGRGKGRDQPQSSEADTTARESTPDPTTTGQPNEEAVDLEQGTPQNLQALAVKRVAKKSQKAARLAVVARSM